MPCTPGMRGCHLACLHRMMVSGYRDSRAAWEYEVESETAGYEEEVRRYVEEHDGGVTFKRWLTSGGWEAYTKTEPQ